MYSRDINILIQSNDLSIQNSLQNLNAAHEFNLIFHTKEILYAIADYIDAVIIDVDNTVDYPCITNTVKPIVIFYSTQLPLSLSAKGNLCLADILWLNSNDPDLLLFNLNKLLDTIKLQRQFFTVNNYLDTLINNVPHLIWFKNLEGLHLKVNDSFCETVGKPKSLVEGKNHYEIWDIPKEVYERSDYVCLDTDVVIIDTLQPQAFDEKIFGKKGLRQVLTHKAPLFDQFNKLIGTLGCAQDITDFKNISTELNLILDNLPFAVLVNDNKNHVLNANQMFQELFNPTNKTLLGQVYSYDKYLLAKSYKYTPSQNQKELILYKNDTEYIFSIQHEPLYDFFQNPLGSLYVYRDITLERNFENRLRQFAYTDQLTGLYQRRYLYEIEEQLNLSTLSLLYIDLDNFKTINDTYGHLFGDELLKGFSDVLINFFVDNKIVRIGGDEFIVLIENTFSPEELIQTVENFFQNTSSFFRKHYPVSVSIGIALANNNNTTFDILLKKADKALYKAKAQGKNIYFVYKD